MLNVIGQGCVVKLQKCLISQGSNHDTESFDTKGDMK